jgi:holliday junction DNA helicase RuvA
VIASLQGMLTAKGKDFVVVQVGGVGFHVFVPQSLLESGPAVGQKLVLYTHMHVRENELALYGCGSEEELSLFGMLLGVSGVGPKVALSILASLPPDRLRMAIAQEDLAALARVPGIGPKTAKKLVFDLKDRIGVQGPAGEPVAALTEADVDLVAALTTLGYSVTEAQEAIRTLPREELPLEERLRLALAYFAS